MAFCMQLLDGTVRQCGYCSRCVVVNIPYASSPLRSFRPARMQLRYKRVILEVVRTDVWGNTSVVLD